MKGFIAIKKANGKGYLWHKPTKQYLTQLSEEEGEKVLPDRAMEKMIVRVVTHKVTFSRCYGAKLPPQCASARFW